MVMVPGHEPNETPGAQPGIMVGSAFLVLSRLFTLAGSFCIMLLLTRHLGSAEYGRYALGMVVQSWSAGLAILLLGGSIVPVVAGLHDGESYAVTMYRLAIAAGLVITAVLLATAGWIAGLLGLPSLEPFVRVIALDAAPAAAAVVQHGVAVARGRVIWAAAMPFAGIIMQLGAVAAATNMNGSAEWAAAAVVASSLVQSAIGHAVTRIPLWRGTGVPVAMLRKRTGKIAGAQMLNRILQNMDLPAVQHGIGGGHMAGCYAGARNIAITCVMLFFPVGGVVQRSVASALRDHRTADAHAAARGFLRTAGIWGGLAAAVSVHAKDIVDLILGPGFSAAAPLLMVLLWTAAFRILSVAGRMLVTAAGESGWQLLIATALSMAGGTAYLIIVPQHGAWAAACISGVLAIISAGIALVAASRGLAMPLPLGSLLRIALAAAASAALGIAMPLPDTHVIIRLILLSALYVLLLCLAREFRPHAAIASAWHRMRKWRPH
jgi:O-antigen/teichoic acid export membrane protein